MIRRRLFFGTSISLFAAGLFYLDWNLEGKTGIPGIALFPLMLLLVVLCCREMLNLANKNHVFPIPVITYAGTLLIIVSGWGSFVVQRIMRDAEPLINASETTLFRERLLLQLERLTPGNWALSAFAVAVILLFIVEIYHYKRPGEVTVRISYTIFIMVYIGLLFTFFTLIRLCHGIMALVSFVAIVKMGDTGAFAVGKIFGRTKMVPRLSPGKTIEGAFGAIIFSCLTAWGFAAFVIPICTKNPMTIFVEPEWIVYGAVMGTIGMFGDLAESVLKRDSEVKDTSQLMPGLGGMLDVMDSLLLAAPVAYAFWTLGLLDIW